MAFFFKKKIHLNIKEKNSSWFYVTKKIFKNKKENWEIRLLIKEDIEKYAEINNSNLSKRKKGFYKTKHFFGWVIKLLTPDFLIGHPNFFDNLKTLSKHPEFKPLRAVFAAWLIFTMVAGSTGVYSLLNSQKILALTLVDDTADEFNAGSYSDTQWDAGNLWVELDTTGLTNGSGTYVSAVKDGTNESTWNSIAWVPERPTGKELPNNATTETGYPEGNIDMTGNILLMHMNNDSDYGENDTTIHDFSGNENNGTATNFDGDEIVSVGCKFNGCLVLDTDYITIQDAPEFHFEDNSYSVSFWFKTTESNKHILGKIGVPAGLQGFYFATAASGVTFYNNVNTPLASGGTYADGNWHHVVGVRESGVAKSIYIDGALANSIGGPVNANDTSTDVLTLGFVTVNFVGSLDEIAIWNRALSADEVLDIYKRGATRLKYQVRSCDDDACSGETLVGPDGTASTYYSELDNDTTSTPSMNLTNVSDNRYFQYKTFFETDNASYSPELKSVTIDYTLLNISPSTPTNSSPANAATNQTLTPALSSSAFSDSDGGDAHAASQWQITTTSGNYSSTVYDSGTDAVNLTSVTVSPALTAGTTYYWHVRHKDDSGAANNWSEYSSETSFTTSYAPDTPTNTLPTSGALSQKITLTLTSSAFSDSDGAASHTASQWLIRSLSDASYASPVYDSGTDVSNLISIAISSGNLSKNTTYFWKIRYKDDIGIWSGYSSETAFSTGVVPVTVISVGSTEYTEGETAKLTVQVKDADGSPINDATVTINVYNPSATKVVTDGSMIYISSSNGLYYYNYVIPATVGVYIYDVIATASGESGYSSHAFHIAQFASDITSIKSIVEAEQTAQATSRSSITNIEKQAKAGILNTETTVKSGDTIKIRYLAESGLTGGGAPKIYVYDGSNNLRIAGADMTEMASSGIYNYSLELQVAWGTGYYTIIVSETTNNTNGNMSLYVGDYDTQSIGSTINTINSNMDILIGAFIVTQSSVSDASSTTTSFISALTNSTDDFYKNTVLTFTSESLNGQSRRISAYDGSTKAITLDPALTSAPANGSTFTIVKQNVRVEEQAAAIQSDVTSIQSDVTYTRAKVDSIYALLGTVDTNLSSAQITVNNIRTSQQKVYKAVLSDISQVQTGSTYRAKLTLLDYEEELTDATSTPTITIYDSTRDAVAENADMTKLSTGVYEYTYSISSGADTGTWEAIVTTAVGSASNQTLNDYFDVTGSPAQVLINLISDSTVPSISASVTITNEGAGAYEYHYEWCVVENQTNQCGGNDDVYYASASKLIQQGADFDTTLSVDVEDIGTYWFKLVVYYGTEASGASRQFTATTAATPTPSVSGGSSSQTLTIDSIGSKINDMQKTMELESASITSALKLLGIIAPSIQTILAVNSQQLDNITDIQNKLADLKAISSSIRQIIENGDGLPVVETYMKFNSVVISFLITNPASIRQTVNFKSPLPVEVKSRDVIDLDGLSINYDTTASSYYVYGSIVLGPKQSISKSVEIKDIWIFDQNDLNSIKEQTESFTDVLKNTQYLAQGVLLKNDINDLINRIKVSQKESYISPQDHILVYRENKANFDKVNSDFDQLKNLVIQSGVSQGLVGKISGIQTFATWGIILAIIFGFGLMGIIIFSMWRYQVVLATQVIQSNKKVLLKMGRKEKRG